MRSGERCRGGDALRHARRRAEREWEVREEEAGFCGAPPQSRSRTGRWRG